MKCVMKRGLQIEVTRNLPFVGDNIVGSEMRGEAILRGLHGNEMRFRNNTTVA
jgi:hypothetical protein